MWNSTANTWTEWRETWREWMKGRQAEGGCGPLYVMGSYCKCEKKLTETHVVLMPPFCPLLFHKLEKEKIFFFKNWSQQGGSVDPMCLWSSLLSCLSVGFVYVTRQHSRVWDRVPTLTFYVKHPTLPSSKLETANCWHSVCWVGMGKCLWTCHKEMFAQHGSACVSSSTLEERQGDCCKCKASHE